ncbi:MAG: OmpA family protein [Myxococcaceae bacterium]
MRLRAILPLVMLAGLAEAADPFARGFDAVPLKLTPAMNSLMIMEGAELAPPKSWQLQASLDLNWGILGLKLGDQVKGDLIPFRSDLHITGAYTFNKRIEVGADIGITFYQASGFKQLRDAGFSDQADPAVAGLDAPRLLGRFNIFSQEDFPIALAGIAEIRLPVGDTRSFLSDRGFIFAPRLALERRFGFIRLIGNVGYRFTTDPGQYLNLYVGQEFTMGVGGKFELPDLFGAKLTRNAITAEVNLNTPAEAPFTFKQADALKTPFELMIGAQTAVYHDWMVVLGLAKGLGLENGFGRETFRVVLGVRYEHIVEPDRDNDGTPDRTDQCPDIPGPKENHGCPIIEGDRDGDGTPDRVDGCPDEVGPAEYDGCPDRDGDQIPDNVDKCPDEPGPADNEGCPVPQEEEVTLESGRIRVRGNILFETAKAIIQPQSFKILDDVAKVLLEHPDVGPVLIEGHTDNRGGHDYNLDLSNRRAAAVEDYLVSKGVERKRLRSQGFSYDRPVATNDTPLGRAKNRRTEFRLLTEESMTPQQQQEKKEQEQKNQGGEAKPDATGGTSAQSSDAAKKPAEKKPAEKPAEKKAAPEKKPAPPPEKKPAPAPPPKAAPDAGTK